MGERKPMASAAAFSVEIVELVANVPAGMWAAVSHDQKSLLAYGADLDDVVRRAKARGEADPIVLRVPGSASAFLL